MISEKEAEALARKVCAEYITRCKVDGIKEARLASQKLMAMAHELFSVLHDDNLKIETVQ